MFRFLKSCKVKNKALNEIEANLKIAVEHLDQGQEYYLPVIYQCLVSKDADVARFAANAISKHMRNLNTAEIINLNDQFRQYSSMEWYICWNKIDLKQWEKTIKTREDFLWIVRLGTFQSNGFFREKCIKELEADKDSIKYLLLRLNDWVEPVRKAAENACKNLPNLTADELIQCLPFLEKIHRSSRRQDSAIETIEEFFATKIWENIDQCNPADIRKYDAKTRLILYRLLSKQKLLNKDKINQILTFEKNSQCQTLIITSLFNKYELSMQELDNYLNHKSKLVQSKALEQKYKTLGDYWNGLEEMLLSPSAKIRNITKYILQKHTNIDINSFYIQHLDTQHKKICILGIGESGKEEDASIITKYLNDANSSIVKNTLHAIGLLLKHKADDIFWKYLQDERPTVMIQAYREISMNNIRYGAKQIYELFLKRESITYRRKLFSLLIKEQYWDRLPYVLMLYSYEDEYIKNLLSEGVYCNNLYDKIPAEKAEMIRKILQDENYKIPPSIQEKINFNLKYATQC